MNWYALYTKPKYEDIVAARLLQARIETYNPKFRIKKYLRNRYTDVIEPLFPCYIFARFNPDKHLWMLTYTRGVKKVVGSHDVPWPVSEEVIHFIRGREQNGVVRVRKVDFIAGDTVRVEDGPLAGITGIFERPMNKDERVQLLLKTLGYQARVIVERAALKKVG